MSSLLPATLLLLLLANTIGGKSHFELSELIEKIHKETNLATVIFQGLDPDFFYNFLNNRPSIPVAIFERSSKGNGAIVVRGKCDWNAFLVVQVTSTNNCEIFKQMISWLRSRKFVIVIADSLESLHRCISYFRTQNFTRIFGIVEGIMYAYLQYANNPLKQFSVAESLPDSMKNLNGYMFRTIISPDLPRVFWFKDTGGNRKVGGYVGQMFVSFLQKHNASFAEINIKGVEKSFMVAVLNATKNKEIDISMNAYKPVTGLAMSYPFSLMSWSIIAPINGHLDPNEYFLRPFFPTVWLAILLTVVYIVLMNILKDYLTRKPVDNVWKYFSEIFNTVLNRSTEMTFKGDYRFYSQVIVMAFVLGNLYTVTLTSFLTVYIQIQQFNSIQELIDYNVPVMMIDYEWKAIEDPELHPMGFEKIVTLVEREVMFRERNSMVNTSFAYAMGHDKATFYLGFQKRFAERTLFRMIEDTLGSYYVGFIVEEFSPFTEILNVCIVEILESGLIQKWMVDAVSQVRDNGLLKMGIVFPERKVPYPLTLYHLRFAWICLESGLIVATVVFVGEQIVKVLRARKLNC